MSLTSSCNAQPRSPARIFLIAAAIALPLTGAAAQLQPKENQPGGVEAMPVPKTQGVMPGAPARAVPPPPPVRAPALATGAKPAAPDASKTKDDGKASGSKKSKKSMKKSSEPPQDGNAPPRSPGNTPTIPGDETQPGGVERAPTVPQPKR